MKTLLPIASALLFFSYTASADCTAAVDPAEKSVRLAEITELAWCWPAATGGVGHVSYVIESRTNLGEWVLEGETDLPEWTLTRNIGDSVELRYFKCDDVECTEYSPSSRKVTILPDFDFDSNGSINGADFFALRASNSFNGETFFQFRGVLNTSLVDSIYVR